MEIAKQPGQSTTKRFKELAPYLFNGAVGSGQGRV